MFPISAFPRARAFAFGAALLFNAVQAYESQEPGAIYPDEVCKPPFGIFQQTSKDVLSCHEQIRVMKIVVGEPAAGSECLVCEGVDCPACVTIIGPCKDPIAPCTKSPTTSTIIPPLGSDGPTTILILTPTPSVSTPPGNDPPVPTYTRPWDGPSTVTVTVPPSGTDPGSVIVSTPAVTPDGWATLTTPWTGSFTTTVTIPPTGTEPGSVIVNTPTPPMPDWNTLTTSWTGSFTTTVTIPPTGTEPGLVIVNTPTPSVPVWNTLTTPWTGTFTTTVTIPPTGTEPGLVIVSTPTPSPPSWTTFTTPWTGTFTTTLTFPPTGTWPGSVVVQTPPARTSVPVPPETEPPSWTTQTVPWTGTFTTTITIPPSGTFPGSVIVSTPFTTTIPITTTSDPVPVETETEEELPVTEVEPSSTEAETSTSEVETETETEPATETETDTETEEPTPTPTAPPTFSCDEGGYLIQGTVLYRLDLETGENPSVSDSVGPGGNVNALGYNILDNYLYGLVQISGSNYQVIQIDAEGGHVLLDTDIDGFHDTGDIDANGQLWIARAQSTSWAQIDLNPESATYGEVVDSGPMTPPGARVADWVYLENGGPYLYSIAWSDTARLVRWSMETKEWEFLFDYGDVTDTPPRFGALYAVGDEMWGSDNNSGDIIAFPVLNEGEPARDIIEGPPSSNNDGARCFLAPALDQAAE